MRKRIEETQEGENSGTESIGTGRREPARKPPTKSRQCRLTTKHIFYMKADMKKTDNQIVVAKHPPKKKLAKGGNKITFLSRERYASMGTGERTAVVERSGKQKEWLREVWPEVVKGHRGQGILSLARGDEEQVGEVEAEEKQHEDEEIEEEKENNEEN